MTSLTSSIMALESEGRKPIVVIFGQEVAEKTENQAGYVVNLRSTIARAHYMARKHLGRQACQIKELYDSKFSFQEYQVGDVV